jgi:hypothetical protein
MSDINNSYLMSDTVDYDDDTESKTYGGGRNLFYNIFEAIGFMNMDGEQTVSPEQLEREEECANMDQIDSYTSPSTTGVCMDVLPFEEEEEEEAKLSASTTYTTLPDHMNTMAIYTDTHLRKRLNTPQYMEVAGNSTHAHDGEQEDYCNMDITSSYTTDIKSKHTNTEESVCVEMKSEADSVLADNPFFGRRVETARIMPQTPSIVQTEIVASYLLNLALNGHRPPHVMDYNYDL